MRHVLVLATAITLLALNIPEAAAQASGIVPGQAVGSLRIGGDIGSVLAALGPLYARDELPGHAALGYYWPLKRVGAVADKVTGKVVALAVSYDEGYLTDKGIHAGAAIDEVRTAYGPGEMMEPDEGDAALVYDDLGIAFVLDRDGALSGRVSIIYVFVRGRYREIFAARPSTPAIAHRSMPATDWSSWLEA